MLGKIGIAALAVLPIFGATHTTDLRQLYNEMYPVNGLTRDAFNLCHESDATFVRALDTDREHCLDEMPHSFAVAIGHIRPDSQVAALGSEDAALKAAFALAAESALPIREPRPGSTRSAAALALPGTAQDCGNAGPGAMTLPAALRSASATHSQSGSAVDDLTVTRLERSRPGEPAAALSLLPLDAAMAASKPISAACPAPA